MKQMPHWMHHGTMSLLICLIGLANYFWGEKIPMTEGSGLDGLVYRAMTLNLEDLVGAHKLNAWSAGHIFPCVVVHYGLRGLGLSLTAGNIVKGFEFLNLALLLLACGVWMLISNELRLSNKGRWLGFMALFVNFATLKQAFYYPVLTDTTAFALGVLCIYFYLKGSTAGMFLTLFAAAFTWRTFVYPATLLLIFPRHPARVMSAQADEFPRVSAAVVTGLFVVVVVCVGNRENPLFADARLAPMLGSVAIVSIASCALYLFFAIRTLLAGLTVRSIGETLVDWRKMHFVSGLGVIALSQICMRALIDTDTPSPDPVQTMVHAYAQLPISRPLIFLIAHIIYFGPMVIVLMLYWSATCEKIRAYGLGMVVFVLAQIVMALNPESRALVHVWPFFVAFLVQVAEDQNWKPHVYAFLVLTSVLLSKVWLPINMPAEPGDPLTFPIQRYAMNFGPWMSTSSYLIQAIAVLLTGLVCFQLTKRETRT